MPDKQSFKILDSNTGWTILLTAEKKSRFLFQYFQKTISQQLKSDKTLIRTKTGTKTNFF